MAVLAIISAISALSLGNAIQASYPPSYNANGAPLEVTTCRTIVGAKPTVNGTLGALAFLEKDNNQNYQTAMNKLNWNLEKQAPMWAFTGMTINDSWYQNFQSEVERQKLLKAGSVYLYTADKNGKPSAQPTGRLSGWYTNDGEASTTFPYLKTQLMHIQKCDFE